MQPGLLPMEKLLYISQHGFHLFLAQKLSVSPTVICFLCVALPSSLGCAGICRYHFCGWVGGPSDVWVYLWINRTWLLLPEKIMKIFFSPFVILSSPRQTHNRSNHIVSSTVISAPCLHGFKDLVFKQMFASMWGRADGTVTEPVYTQTSFCQSYSGQGAALESQKYKAAKTKEVRINKERESQNSDEWVQRHNWVGPSG